MDHGRPFLESHASESTAASDSSPQAPNLYHEKQVGRLCGMHCVNNLLQRKAYQAADFHRWEEELADQEASLSWWGFPRMFRCLCTTIGHPDFSVGSLTMALADAGLELQWFDRRRSLEELNLEDPCLVGVIVNLVDERKSCCKDTWERHWFSILGVETKEFYNLDSRLRRPALLGDAKAAVAWIHGALSDGDSCVFRVRRLSEEESSAEPTTATATATSMEAVEVPEGGAKVEA